MVPVYNEDKEVVNFRYIMSEANKREHMKKRDHFDEVLPAGLASIEDKVNTKPMNREVIDLLKKEWIAFADNEDTRFVEVGPAAKTEAGKEMWSLLPKDTQIAAREAFGADVLYVKDDMANMVLGFRKMMFSNNKFLGRAAPAIRIADKIWQEIIQWERFRIAVLNPVVVFGNMISNIMLLLSQGIPPAYIWRMSQEAIFGMRKYQQQVRERDELANRISTKISLHKSTRADQAQLARLEASLRDNTVNKLVEEGLFTSIVEEFGNDENSTRRKLATKVMDKFGSLTGSQTAMRVGRETWMVPGSETAQLALLATQYGDFVGRYVQFNYQTKIKKVSERQAIHEALDTFIYYNIPQNRILQAMNDYGLLMFTKFFFRIQHIVVRMFKRNPVQASIVLGLGTATDSRVWGENISRYAFANNFTRKFDLWPVEDITSGELMTPTLLKWIPDVFIDMFRSE